MNFKLEPRTIFLVLAGSRSYGFHTPESDYDYRGIAIAPIDNYIGILNHFEQIVDGEGQKNVYKHFSNPLIQPNSDMQIMELSKLTNLAAQCNPNIIEILFTDPKNIIINHPVMDKFILNKQMFLSKQAKARFCGYAMSQLKRINRHKRWIDNPPTHQPTREEFGLPEYTLLSQDQLGAANALIKKEADNFTIHQDNLPDDVKIELNNNLKKMLKAIWVSLHNDIDFPIGDGKKFTSTEDALYFGIAKEQGFTDNFLQVLNSEKKYRSAMQEWKSFKRWEKERNPARAEIERKYKFDRKHATHLVRLIRMAREILELGEVRVFRPDAEELRAIRNGDWTYEQIVEFSESEDIALDEVVKKSSLPAKSDMNKINDMVVDSILEFNLGHSIKINSKLEDQIREAIKLIMMKNDISNLLFCDEDI